VATIGLARIESGAIREVNIVLEPRQPCPNTPKSSSTSSTVKTTEYSLYFDEDPSRGLHFKNKDEVWELLGLISDELGVKLEWNPPTKAPGSNRPERKMSGGIRYRPVPGKEKSQFEVRHDAFDGWLVNGRDKGHKLGYTLYVYGPAIRLIAKVSTPRACLREEAIRLAKVEIESRAVDGEEPALTEECQ